MLPIPTRAALFAGVGLLLMLAVGLAGGAASIVLVANAGFVGLALVLAVTRPVGRHLRRQRLEFAWWLDHGTGAASGAVVPGVDFVVRCYVRHRGAGDIAVDTIEPIVGANASVRQTPRGLYVAGRARSEFTMTLRAASVGRVVLHGLAITVRGPLGLFRTALYFPNPLVIRVLPRAAARRRSGRRAPQAAAVERSGHTMVRRRGGGTELHELREHVPGDPFKSIAWKASARRGRLMVKEVEQEVQEKRWVLVDASGTMRGGALGERKLDFAIDLAAGEAMDAVRSGDRVGLLAFDRRVVTQVPLGEGNAHRIRIFDALLSLTELVDDDLTSTSDEAVLATVAAYVRRQDGIDFGRGAKVDARSLAAHVRRALEQDRKGRKIPEREVRAQGEQAALFRAFCRSRALPILHRAHPIEHEKTAALIEALTIVSRQRTPSTIVVCTDFDAMVNLDDLATPLRLARAHGHTVHFVLPDGRSFVPDAQDALGEDLRTIFGRAETQRLRSARALLARLGVRASVLQGRRAGARSESMARVSVPPPPAREAG